MEPLDLAVARILVQAVDEQRFTRRRLADAAGMGLNRIGLILRMAGPPATVGEVANIAGVLGLTPSQVFAEAERDLEDPLGGS